MDDAGDPAEAAQADVDEKIGAAAALEQHGHERHPDGEEVEKDVALQERQTRNLMAKKSQRRKREHTVDEGLLAIVWGRRSRSDGMLCSDWVGVVALLVARCRV